MKLRDQFQYNLYWGKKDKIFIVEVPQLPGCMAHGKTQEKALKNAKQAAQLWLDVAKKAHREIPQPKGDRLVYA